jgi:transposase
MGTKRTAEFRQEAVRVALTSGLTRKQVASDFGIGFSTLSKWVQQDRKNPEKPTAQSDLERENAELRKENRLLREEYPCWSSENLRVLTFHSPSGAKSRI